MNITNNSEPNAKSPEKFVIYLRVLNKESVCTLLWYVKVQLVYGLASLTVR